MHKQCIVWLTLCWILSSGCGSDFGDKTSGQACTRSAQCKRGLRCLEGFCHPRKKRAPPADEGARDAGEPDAEVEPEPTTGAAARSQM